MQVVAALQKTDWKLLREQKAQLLSMQGQSSATVEHAIDGLINWIDALQDAAVNDNIATQLEVFGE